MLWNSLEVPWWGTSNEFHYMFSSRNKKNHFFFFFFQIKKKSTLFGAMYNRIFHFYPFILSVSEPWLTPGRLILSRLNKHLAWSLFQFNPYFIDKDESSEILEISECFWNVKDVLSSLALNPAKKNYIWKCHLFISSAASSCKLFKHTFCIYRQTVWTLTRGAVWSESTLFAIMT